jgi:membrane protein YqaA with SNARE-associated domain
MEDILLYATFSILFATLASAVGGFLSYALDCHDSRTKPMLTWASHHSPTWDKNGSVVARHESCSTCEITVIHAGGELVGHSSME